MTNKEIISKVTKYLSEITNDLNFELVDVEFVKEGPNHYLRGFIDKENSITINDCEIVSRQIEKILDEEDFIDFPYILEISSPGIDRKLKKEEDFIKYSGRLVDIKLFKSQNNHKELQGELVSFNKETNTIHIIFEDDEMAIPFKNIVYCKLAVIF